MPARSAASAIYTPAGLHYSSKEASFSSKKNGSSPKKALDGLSFFCPKPKKVYTAENFTHTATI